MVWTIGLLCISIVLQLPFRACLECYSCTGVSKMADCKSIIQCPAGSMCFTHFKSNNLSLGCIASTLCPATNTSTSMQGSSGSLVGRSLTARTQDECSACCSTSNCNRQLCQSDDPSCYDSGNFDCDAVGELVNICAETDHAKLTCRRYCGLCNIVDGGWAAWTSWSSCSLSCGNGTETKTRSCSNPIPANGGSDCTGVSNETRACSRDLCPVNGGWSKWSPWGSCSITCGIGLRRRDRSCTSPYPSSSGLHCLGDSRDDGICLPGACQDGGWSGWSSWSPCSKTCGNGVQTSSRNCTNPTPSLLGKACVGNDDKVRTCFVKRCVDTNIGFVVNCISGFGTDHNALFSHVITNQGGGYNTSTGVFTCSVPGVYAFSLNILKHNSVASAYCSIYKNNTFLSKAHVDPNKSGQYLPASATVYVHLVTGDCVLVKDCSPPQTIHPGHYTSFTGYLMNEDR